MAAEAEAPTGIVFTIEDLPSLLGRSLLGDWMAVEKPKIKEFESATYVVDEEYAFPVEDYPEDQVQGLQLLGLLPQLVAKAFRADVTTTYALDYGFDKVRYLTRVSAGQRMRLHGLIRDVRPRDEGYVTLIDCTVELEGHEQSAFVAEWLAFWLPTSASLRAGGTREPVEIDLRRATSEGASDLNDRSADSLCFMSALDLADAIRRREVSPTEVLEAFLERIDRVNPGLNAFVTVLPDEARAAAEASAAQLTSRSATDLGRLHGVPIAVKDLTPTAGVRTTFGSPHFADYVPTEDSLAWARLKAAGAILIGKTTTPEFGWLGITDGPLTGVTNNPWRLDRTAGGSSGGSAVAVATGMAPIGTGSDGSGSIRIPAAFCGIVGLKPSVGRIPYYGEEDVYQDTGFVGPMTRTVADAALMLSVMAGPDEREPYSIGSTEDFVSAYRSIDLRGVRVAFSPTIGGFEAERDTLIAVTEAARWFEGSLGATVDELAIDMIDSLTHMLRFHAPSLAVFVEELQRERGVDLSMSHPGIKYYAEMGKRVTGTEHFRATITERGQIHERIAAVFADHDLLITPTVPVTAFPHPGPEGGPFEIAGRVCDDPVIGFMPFTEPFNMTGHPAITVPCGFDSEGMPIGMQIVGRHGSDAVVLAAAAAFEEGRPWSGRRPSALGE